VSSPEAAQDIAATTFNRALETIDRYSYRGRPVLAWLYGIAGNLVKETLRNEARQRRAGLVEGFRNGHTGQPPPESLHEDRVDELVSRMDLQRSMRHLTEAQHEVVLLRYFAGLSASETGRIMNRPETAVYALQARALSALLRQLSDIRA
jgi:RNA polymerase sigma-70 factor, ECF subfamily